MSQYQSSQEVESTGTSEVLSQSRAILYGAESVESNGNGKNDFERQFDNQQFDNTKGQSSNNNDNALIQTGENSNNTDSCSLHSLQGGINCLNTGSPDYSNMPAWAASMSERLISIQSQLEQQNSRWQRVEYQLETQNARMSKVESQISQIGVLQRKVEATDRSVTIVGDELKSMKSKMREYDKDIIYYSEVCDDLLRSNTDLGMQLTDIVDRLDNIESMQKRTNEEVLKTNEKIIDVRWRSMRENLIFHGIPESESHQATENCEMIIKNFIRMEMNISKDIPFDRVHRLGRYFDQQRFPRPIMAKFTYFKDKELVSLQAPRTLINTCYMVKEQYPAEIE